MVETSQLPQEWLNRYATPDLIYAGLKRGVVTWEHVHGSFMLRDLTRDDIRNVLRLALFENQGNYILVSSLFGIEDDELAYGRFMATLRQFQLFVSPERYCGRIQFVPDSRPDS